MVELIVIHESIDLMLVGRCENNKKMKMGRMKVEMMKFISDDFEQKRRVESTSTDHIDGV